MDLVNMAYAAPSTSVEERMPGISIYGIVPMIIIFLAIALLFYLNHRRK
jgi:hypothetical protein